MEVTSEAILTGKVMVMVAGGFDDPWENSSYDFGSMKATSNSEMELAMGRESTEMSRPTTTTRAGVRPLVSPADLPSLNLTIVGSCGLRVSVYAS
jgi:hypothetical protein